MNTDREWEARELLAREYERGNGNHDEERSFARYIREGGNDRGVRCAIRAIIAALTREQREGVHGTKDCGIEQSAKAVFVPCDCGCGRQCCAHCGTDLGFVQEKPQPEGDIARALEWMCGVAGGKPGSTEHLPAIKEAIVAYDPARAGARSGKGVTPQPGGGVVVPRALLEQVDSALMWDLHRRPYKHRVAQQKLIDLIREYAPAAPSAKGG